MTPNTSHGRIRSAMGEHLVALLVVAIVVLGLLTAYPALASGAEGTAAQAQERVNLPMELVSQLDEQSATPSTP